MNYLSYWSLRRKPFLFTLAEDFFSGPPQREALAGLNYFIAHAQTPVAQIPAAQTPIAQTPVAPPELAQRFQVTQNLAMLICPRQNGLSWLLAHVSRMRGFGDQAVELISTPGNASDSASMRSELCRGMGFELPDRDTEPKIEAALTRLDRQGVRLVWLVDRCDPHTAAMVIDLAERHDRLSVVIGCTPDSTRQIIMRLGRVPMQIDLSPLTLDDTCEYVRCCLERAGADPRIISDNSAIRLHEVTGGRIGGLSVAAEASLALAARHQLRRVSPAVVEAYAEQSSAAA